MAQEVSGRIIAYNVLTFDGRRFRAPADIADSLRANKDAIAKDDGGFSVPATLYPGKFSHFMPVRASKNDPAEQAA